MSDLIEREAAGRPKTFDELCEDYRHLRMQAIKHQNYADDKVAAIIEAARSLPAAVPVVNVERAAQAYCDIDFPDSDPTPQDRTNAQAILDAGYVGSVAVEDVRQVAAGILDACNCDNCAGAAKRVLAATEGR